MKANGLNLKLDTQKLKRSFLIFLCSPKILYRYVLFSLKKRNLNLHSFSCSANYCINGTLNQLTWNVENAIFLALDNSSRIYFGSGEHIFKVSRDKTRFELKCYGLGKGINAYVQLKITELEPSDFNGVSAKNQQVELKKNSFQVAMKNLMLSEKVLESKPVFLQPIIPHEISTETHREILNRLSKLQKTKTLRELRDLEEFIN